MKPTFWLLAIAFVGYSYWAVNYWHCHKCHCCAGAPPPEPQEVVLKAPMFKWNTDAPVPDSNFTAWKKAFLAKAGQGDTLLITGLYRAKENLKTKSANLGIARAAALMALMKPEMPDSRMRIAAKLVDDKLAAGGEAMESAEFTWLKMRLKKEEGAIIESDNAVTFLFPFNSTEKDSDPKVDAYLRQLVDKHKATQTTFSIVGHTDNVGEDAENVALGLGRANAIRQFLVQNGIAAERIKVESKGESEPLADNNTEDGRHQNRRVVLTVNR